MLVLEIELLFDSASTLSGDISHWLVCMWSLGDCKRRRQKTWLLTGSLTAPRIAERAYTVQHRQMHCLSKESIFVATCFSSWSNLFPNCLQGTVKSSSEHWLLSWFRLRHCLKANLRIIDNIEKNSTKKYWETIVQLKLLWYSKCCLYNGTINTLPNVFISVV